MELARQIRRVIRRHRDLAPMRLGQLPVGTSALEFYDRSPALPRACGLSDGVSVAALQLLWIMVSGFAVQESSLCPATGFHISSRRRATSGQST